jgi:hypothetical protein
MRNIDRNNLTIVESIGSETYKMGVVTSHLVRDVSAQDDSLLVYEEYAYTDGRRGWSIYDQAGKMFVESSTDFNKQWWKDNL